MTWDELVDQILSTLTEEERKQPVRMAHYDEEGPSGCEVELLRMEEDLPGWLTWDHKGVPPGFIKKGEPYLC